MVYVPRNVPLHDRLMARGVLAQPIIEDMSTVDYVKVFADAFLPSHIIGELSAGGDHGAPDKMSHWISDVSCRGCSHPLPDSWNDSDLRGTPETPLVSEDGW
jgi:hypothetical protein